jgi:hypothetical protein
MDNKMDLREIGWGGMDCIGYGPVVGSNEHNGISRAFYTTTFNNNKTK